MTTQLPLSADDLGGWRSRIDADLRARKPHEKEWDANLDAYRMHLAHAPVRDTVVVPKDYANVNQKAAQLFFQTPDVQCLPMSPLMDGRDDAVLMFQTVLNAQLGPRGAHVKRAMDETIFDALCPSGIGAAKIGYDAVTVDVDQPVLDPTGVPVPDLEADPSGMTPQLESVPVPKRETWRWDRFSPKKLVVPSTFDGNDFDLAPYLGMQFAKPEAVAKREYGIGPEVELQTTARDEQVLNADAQSATRGESTEKLIKGIEIWYQAAIYDATVLDPLRYRCLVLIDGLEAAAKHVDSPYQVVGPDGFVDETRSMIGNPIHVLTLRPMADTAWQPSDCTITRILVNELGKFRTQTIQQRDANRGVRLYDDQAIQPETLRKILAGDAYVGVTGLNAGNPPIIEAAKSTIPRENWTAQDYIDRDISEAWAMGSNQRGLQEDNSRTATEIQTTQANTDVRLDAERGRVLAYFLRGVEQKLAPLIVRFYDPPDLIGILGEQGAQRWMQWDKAAISIKWAFSAKPDSQIRVDAARDRKQALDLYQMTANDPNVNRVELLNGLFRRHNQDPTKVVVAQVPEKGPEPPKISYAFKAEDLLSPAAPVVMKLLTGEPITPQDFAAVQSLAAQYAAAEQQAAYVEGASESARKPSPPHGGAAAQAEGLSKHAQAQTGAMQGSGQQTPYGAGGVM